MVTQTDSDHWNKNPIDINVFVVKSASTCFCVTKPVIKDSFRRILHTYIAYLVSF